MPISLCMQKGCIVAKCNDLSPIFLPLKSLVPESARMSRDARDGPNSYHITITTPAETSQLIALDEANFPVASDIAILGLAFIQQGDSEAWSAVVHCPTWQKFRYSLGLPEKDFHVTLGYHVSDPHNPSSSYLIQNMVHWIPTEYLESQFDRVINIPNSLDLIYDSAASNFPLVRQQVQIVMERLFESSSASSCKPLPSTVERLKEMGRIATNAHFHVLSEDIGWFLLRAGYLFGLRLVLNSIIKLNRSIDMTQLKRHFPVNIAETMETLELEKVHKNIVELNKLVLAHGHQSIDKCFVFCLKDTMIEQLSLPRNFSWVQLPSSPSGFENEDIGRNVEKYLLAGCAYPGNVDQMLALYFVGIRQVITIHEGPLSPVYQVTSTALEKKLAGKPAAASGTISSSKRLMEFTHIACNDRTPPTRQQMQEEVIPIMHRHISKKEGVLVHCLGGLGRTNTLIIGYLMYLKQISASIAIDEVTRQRRIILSESQKGFLREWYKVVTNGFCAMSHALALTEEAAEQKLPLSSPPSLPQSANTASTSYSTLANAAQPTLPIPPSVSLRDYQKMAQVIKLPPIIMLCGLPASGKSTFAKALVEAQPKFFVRVNRDEMRGKGEVDRALADALQPYLKATNGSNHRKTGPVTQCIIIDNCHVTVAKRREWFDAVHRLPTWCVYLDRPVDVCKTRIMQRTDHPTIPAGPAGIPIIESMRRQFEAPDVSEGFSQVIRIQSDEDMMQLLQSWKIPFQAPISTAVESAENAGAVDGNSGSEDDEEEAGAGKAADVFQSDKPIKFPRTAHALNLGAATRDDKILPPSDLQNWISNRRHLLIEEKVDGANIGFHIRGSDHRIIAQNRSHYISSAYHPQFALLDKWIARHTEDLWEILEPDRTILYGEWLYATHSVYYDALPNYFIAYDLYDVTTKTFLPRQELARRLSRTKLTQVPLVFEGVVESQDHLRSLVFGESQYGAPRREGIVIRLCDGDKVIARAKLVRQDFIAGNERWNRSSKLQTNQLKKTDSV